MDNMPAGSGGDRNRTMSGMWPMWFCIGIGILALLSFFFWR